MDDVLARLTALETAHRRLQRTLRRWRATALGVVVLSLVGGVFMADVRPLSAQGFLPIELGRLLTRITEIEQAIARHDLVVRHFSPGPPRAGVAADGSDAVSVTEDLTLTGNLYIVNGQGSTNTTNGSGNLIVGYNETGNPSGDVRTGSHNVIVGSLNSFSSYGGAVVGHTNTISGVFASVVGGSSNKASGAFAAVSGGTSNVASNSNASVSGGISNTASGDVASVSGGANNTASGAAGSASGGHNRTASSTYQWVAGGLSQSN